jgi:hypothetical protein
VPEPLTINLGGIPIGLIPDQKSGGFSEVKRASNFFSDLPAEINLTIHCGWFPEKIDWPVAFETDADWQLLQAPGQWVIKKRSANQDPYQMGVFPPDYRTGEIYVAPSLTSPGDYVFPLSDSLGELYLISLLGTGLGVMFHSAGVIHRGQGYLFAAHGGGGKTTTANLWQGQPDVRVINDDKVIVRKVDGEFRMYGTPWPGQGGMALAEDAPLKRVFILKQAPENSVTDLSFAQASALLLARSFTPLWNAGGIAYTLQFLDELCQAVPCQELSFLPDSSAVEFVRQLP